jgi:hypothetical protein
MLPTVQTCKTCGNSFTGKYCNQCGEKVYTEKDRTFRHIADETIHFVTHFEGSFLRTVKTIFTKPGKLAYDYCNGTRKKYFKPISLFLLCIVLYLLFPRFDGLNMKFSSYVSSQNNYTWLAIPVAKKKMKSASITEKELNDKYNRVSAKVSKIFLLALIPLSAFFLYLLFFRKGRYFFDHFIMATEFNSLMVIVVFLLLPLLVVVGTWIYSPVSQYFVDSNLIPFISVHFILLIFLSFGFKRFYQQSWLLTIIKSIIFLLLFDFVIMYIYHCLLFFLVMLFI